MKKIVFLIETENGKFLIYKQKNGFSLPVLFCDDSIQILIQEVLKKYNLEVDCIGLVEKNTKYTLVRCRLRNQYNVKKFREDILKNMENILIVKYQREIINNTIFKIHKELLNDAIWLGILLRSKIEIKNIHLKTIITGFILFYSTVFCDEVMNFSFGELRKDSNITRNDIKKLRNYYLKDFPSPSSKKTKKIFNSMGIDFNKYDFDIRVYIYNNEIIDVNSRTWMENYNTNFDLYNGIILTPRNWVKNMFPPLEDAFEEACEPFVDDIKNVFNKVNVKNKIYSSNKLISEDLDEISKTYILQRIGLLKTVMMISNLFFKNIRVVSSDVIEISFDKFLRKTKAVIIGILGTDREKVPVLNEVLSNIPYEFDDNFFVLNRNCRNNLHYGFYNELLEEEIKILDEQQDIYLNYVIGELEKHMKLKLDFCHYFLLGLAHLQRWAEN